MTAVSVGPVGGSFEAARLRASVELDLAELEESLYRRLLQRLETPAQGWLSVKSAATYLNTTEAAVRQLIRRGHLRPHRPTGGSLRLSRQEIDQWVRGE